jgi:hypothetical protein
MIQNSLYAIFDRYAAGSYSKLSNRGLHHIPAVVSVFASPSQATLQLRLDNINPGNLLNCAVQPTER